MLNRRGFLASLSLPVAASLAPVVPALQAPRIIAGTHVGRAFYSLRGFVLVPGAVIRYCTFRGLRGPSGGILDATAWWRSKIPGWFTDNWVGPL